MGHVRLGVLSKSRKWQQVVEELRLGADVDIVAASAADAAEASLQAASKDPAFLHSFWLLTQIPLAARGPAFAEELRRLGLAVPNRPSLLDVAAAFSGAVDRYAHQSGGRTDLGEMAQMAAVESLTATVGPTLPLHGFRSLMSALLGREFDVVNPFHLCGSDLHTELAGLDRLARSRIRLFRRSGAAEDQPQSQGRRHAGVLPRTVGQTHLRGSRPSLRHRPIASTPISSNPKLRWGYKSLVAGFWRG